MSSTNSNTQPSSSGVILAKEPPPCPWKVTMLMSSEEWLTPEGAQKEFIDAFERNGKLSVTVLPQNQLPAGRYLWVASRTDQETPLEDAYILETIVDRVMYEELPRLSTISSSSDQFAPLSKLQVRMGAMKFSELSDRILIVERGSKQQEEEDTTSEAKGKVEEGYVEEDYISRYVDPFKKELDTDLSVHIKSSPYETIKFLRKIHRRLQNKLREAFFSCIYDSNRTEFPGTIKLRYKELRERIYNASHSLKLQFSLALQRHKVEGAHWNMLKKHFENFFSADQMLVDAINSDEAGTVLTILGILYRQGGQPIQIAGSVAEDLVQAYKRGWWKATESAKRNIKDTVIEPASVEDASSLSRNEMKSTKALKRCTSPVESVPSASQGRERKRRKDSIATSAKVTRTVPAKAISWLGDADTARCSHVEKVNKATESDIGEVLGTTHSKANRKAGTEGAQKLNPPPRQGRHEESPPLPMLASIACQMKNRGRRAAKEGRLTLPKSRQRVHSGHSKKPDPERSPALTIGDTSIAHEKESKISKLNGKGKYSRTQSPLPDPTAKNPSMLPSAAGARDNASQTVSTCALQEAFHEDSSIPVGLDDMSAGNKSVFTGEESRKVSDSKRKTKRFSERNLADFLSPGLKYDESVSTKRTAKPPLKFRDDEVDDTAKPAAALAWKRNISSKRTVKPQVKLRHDRVDDAAKPAAPAPVRKTNLQPGESNPVASSAVAATSFSTEKYKPSQIEIEGTLNDRARKSIHSWYDRLNDFSAYYDEHGHGRVPQKFEENLALGIWVNKQREQKKKYDRGERSSLTERRISLLEEAHFEWAKSKGERAWEDQFKDLISYKTEHHHCNVPTKCAKNRSLGRWVSAQRSSYKRYLKGEESTLTDERVERLNSLGFNWALL